MKTVAAIFTLCASILFAGTNIVNTSNQLEVGAYVSLPSNEQYAKGFLEYKGQHQGIIFCALIVDSGSAIPSGDFRLYAKVKGLYRKVLSLPMLTRKGYRCTCEADTLKVYLTRTYKKNKKPNDKDLLLTINLTKLVEAHTEQKKVSNTSRKPDIAVQGRLVISIPDGNFYNLASDPTQLGSTGARFHDILLTDSQMSKILNLVRNKHSLSWVNMTAESPYPKSHTILLWFGSASDSGMCNLGTAKKAIPILQNINACLPEASQQEFRKSLSGMKVSRK